LLDVDGVLIDGRPSDGRPWTHSLHQDMGIDPEELVREFFLKDWQSIVLGQRDLLPTLSAVLERFPGNVTARELVSYWFEMDSRVVDDVLSDCSVARDCNMTIYLATNQDHLRARYIMENLGLRDIVDGILYSAKVGARKPDAEFYRSATIAVGTAPDDIVLVDDTPRNIEAARQFGWRGVHWTKGASLGDIIRHHNDT